MPSKRRQTTSSDIWIGTSGWTYDSWRGPFYPTELPKKNWLSWYTSQFPTTEINGSFYRTPSLEAVRAWRDLTPRDFVFAWKASKYITHWKRLGVDVESSIDLLVTRLKALGDMRSSSAIQAGTTRTSSICCSAGMYPYACRIITMRLRLGF
jgi:uncharacterized protein YecE (DUF72 family)